MIFIIFNIDKTCTLTFQLKNFLKTIFTPLHSQSTNQILSFYHRIPYNFDREKLLSSEMGIEKNTKHFSVRRVVVYSTQQKITKRLTNNNDKKRWKFWQQNYQKISDSNNVKFSIQHAQPPRCSVSVTASGMPWKYL